MDDNEKLEFENRVYVNPDISRDEQTAFIDTLRSLQDEKNAQIATETHNLGTDVEPHLGGLSGSEDYWKAKYQTPQTEYAIANLKAAAQQSALNTAMTDYNNMLQNRYQQAYRDYNKRLYEHNRARERKADSYYDNYNNSNNNNNSDGGETTKKPDVENKDTSKDVDMSGEGVKMEGLFKAKLQSLQKQYMKEGMSFIDAYRKAMEDLGANADEIVVIENGQTKIKKLGE